MVDTHIEELRRQLADKKSVFSWVKAWNAYAGTFFTTNFGKPANCYGQEHVDMALETLERIQRAIFNDDGGVAQYLKTTIQQRFGTSDIPDGFLYFPIELGGLELQNTFISLLQIRDSLYEKPFDAITYDFTEAEIQAYRHYKTAYENGQVRTPRSKGDDDYWDFDPPDKDTFLPFEEFTRYRSEFHVRHGGGLLKWYMELLQQPKEQSIGASTYDKMPLNEIHTTQGTIGQWATMTAYWRWVVQLYGRDMIERFGGLEVVERGVLPIGMVGLFRSGRVRWQG